MAGNHRTAQETAEFLTNAGFSEEEQNEITTEFASISQVERRDIMNMIRIAETQERLELMKNASLQNIKIFEEKQKLNLLKEEYYKLLLIAEKLGDEDLFSSTLEKLEELKVKLDSSES